MPASAKSFQHACKVQASVETESLVMFIEHVTRKRQKVAGHLAVIPPKQLAQPLGKSEALLADNGYYCEVDLKECQGKRMLIAALR